MLVKQLGRVEFLAKGQLLKPYFPNWKVQFESAQVAGELLSKRYVVIEEAVKIDIPCIERNIDDGPVETANINDLLLDPPDQTSEKNILNALNDNCLRRIFKKLNLLDISSVAVVCLRFNKIAKEFSASKYRDEKLNCNLFHSNYYTLATIEDCFRKFGSLFTSISTKYDDKDYKSVILLGMIDEYCKNIKEIEIEMDTDYYSMKNIRFLAGIGSDNELIPLLSRLEKLRIFKKIETGRLYHSVKIFDLIAQNSLNIQELDFSGITFYFTNPHFVLYFDNSEPSKLAVLSQLKNLKKLIIGFYCSPIASHMQALSSNNMPIEILGVIDGEFDNDAIKFISEMKSITTLELTRPYNLNDEHLTELAQNLPNLNNIKIFKQVPIIAEGSRYYDFNSFYKINITLNGIKKMLEHANQLSILTLDDAFEPNDHMEIENIIQNRTNHIKLDIIIQNSTVDVSVNSQKYSFNGKIY